MLCVRRRPTHVCLLPRSAKRVKLYGVLAAVCNNEHLCRQYIAYTHTHTQTNVLDGTRASCDVEPRTDGVELIVDRDRMFGYMCERRWLNSRSTQLNNGGCVRESDNEPRDRGGREFCTLLYCTGKLLMMAGAT